MVKRNEDGPPGEIVNQKKVQIREEVRHTSLKENPNAAQQAAGNHQRFDRPILTIKPRNDGISDGIPKFHVEQDLTRRQIIANLTRQEYESQRKADGINVPARWTKNQPISEETKSIMLEQGNMEAKELMGFNI